MPDIDICIFRWPWWLLKLYFTKSAFQSVSTHILQEAPGDYQKGEMVGVVCDFAKKQRNQYCTLDPHRNFRKQGKLRSHRKRGLESKKTI